jgi:AcrR family transcriptional regulator
VSGAARVLAATNGQASMNDVATAVGVARGTLYRYFPTREALLERLRSVAVEDGALQLEAARVEQVDPLEGLERSIRVLVELGDPFVVAAWGRSRATSEPFETAIMRRLRTVVERGQAAGAVRADLPAAWLSETLLGLVLAASGDSALGREDTIASIKALFLDGARAR